MDRFVIWPMFRSAHTGGYQYASTLQEAVKVADANLAGLRAYRQTLSSEWQAGDMLDWIVTCGQNTPTPVLYRAQTGWPTSN